ncbi:MAG: MTAP family purine nucleoside phosphorylase [Nitrospinae bacterium]|nr:MTAP family purine nucleoside phosphorylase [Nitrospinota bacterium]
MSKLAIIGGSGAYDLLRRSVLGEPETEQVIQTPFGPSAPIRRFGGAVPFHFLSRHGEERYSTAASFVNYRANIWALKETGVERIVAWSGPGIINPSFEVGAYAVPHDVIDQTKSRQSTFFTKGGLGFIRMQSPFCPDLRHSLIYALSGEGKKFYPEAVYVCTEGPRLETPAEIRLFHSYGADLVGMTLLPEAFLARELEMCYSALCYLTNYAEGICDRDFKGGELFEGMQNEEERSSVVMAMDHLPRLAIKALETVAPAPRGCQCKDAMLRYRKSGVIGSDFRDWIKL